MCSGVTFRCTGRNDVSLILEFIISPTASEQLPGEALSDEETLGTRSFDQHKAKTLPALVDGQKIGFALFFTIFPPPPAGRVWILSPCSCCLNTAAGALIPRRSKNPAAIAVEHKRDSLKWQCLDRKQPGIAFERTQYSDRSFSKRAPNTQRG